MIAHGVGPATIGEAPAHWEDADVVTSADAYADRFAGPVGAWFLEVQARRTLALLPSGRPLRVLDVGGGHAQLAPHLIDAGHDVTVLGSRQSCAQRLEPWLQAGRCRFDVGNLATLPYADASFDVVLGFRLLAHVADWRGLLCELCRVARRAVIADYPSSRSANAVSRPLFRLKKGVEKSTRPFRVLTPTEVSRFFDSNAFKITHATGQFILPMVLYRALGSARFAALLETPARQLGLTRFFGSPVIIRAVRRSALSRGAGDS